MSKAITGAVELAGAAAILAFVPGLSFAATPWLMSLMVSLAAGGATAELGALAGALGSKQGLGITTRTPSALRQIIRGERRVGGTIVYQSTTGSTHRQYNMVIALAGHPVESIVNLYLDGRQVFWYPTPHTTTANFNRTRPDGINFGGDADGSDHIGPNGVKYNFGGKVFCEAFYGDQDATDDQSGGVLNPTGGFSTALHANDPTWARDGGGNTPYLAGCTWVYLKIEADQGAFPQFPEIRFTIRGKNDVLDPRTGLRGYTTNWALHVADAISDPVLGLGDPVNQAQLIAAANVCDELVTCAAGSERRYTLHWAYDTGTAPGEAVQHMMAGAQGRTAWVGGEWFIFPAYWQGPSFTFDKGSLLDAIRWSPRRAVADLANRVTGTYIAPNYPYNTAGDLYDSNGYWNGSTPNTFPFAFQPTNFPQYAADPSHGYSEDVYLVEDTPNSGAWDAGTAYAAGTVIIYNGAPWQALQAVPAGTVPASGSAYWGPVGNYLPAELSLDTVLSVSQAQRCAKIYLLRKRQQGTGLLAMQLSAFQAMPLDVIQMNVAELGWINKVLEIAGEPGTELKLRYAAPPQAEQGGEESTSALWLEVPVNECDPSVYDWDPATEELAPDTMTAMSGGVEAFVVAPPTGLGITDSATTALLLGDGSTQPRILVSWTAPVDTYVTNGGSIQIQWKDADNVFQAGAWIDAPAVSGQATSILLDVAAALAHVSVQIRSVRPNGATSDWEVLGTTPVSSPDATVGFPFDFSIIPTSPTPALGTSTTDLATTQFVANTVAAAGTPSGVHYTAAGAIAPTAVRAVLQAGSAAAMTLAAPGSDWIELTIVALDAFAYTVTTPANKINGAKSVATWTAAAGNCIKLVAYGGVWYTTESVNGVALT